MPMMPATRDRLGHASAQSLPIHEKSGSVVKEAAKNCVGVGGERRLIQGAVHQRHPTVASGAIDVERSVASAQSWVAALLGVAWGTAKPEDEEVPQALLCRCKVVLLVHRAEDCVRRNLRVERGHEPVESIFADRGVDIAFVHYGITTESAENAESCRLGVRIRLTAQRAVACFEHRQNCNGNPLRPLRSLW